MTSFHQAYRFWTVAGVVAFLGGCGGGGDDVDNNGGSTGTSGATSAGASSGGASGSGTGGTGGTGTAGATTSGKMCPTPVDALITDFTYMETVPPNTTAVSFGDAVTNFSGGTFVYPAAADVPTPMYPMTSDVTGSSWHISGDVGTFSGFGIYFQDCQMFDGSGFRGIQFTLGGNVAMGSTITLNVGTAPDDIAASWFNTHKAMPTDPDKVGFGRCMPVTGQYDGTCGNPLFNVTVPATPGPITVLWADLIGGKPQASVSPNEITFISWNFPNPPGAGTTAAVPYAADITLDDLSFLP